MYKLITLSNGVRVITEHIPYVKSVSVGIWVGSGSRSENSQNNGISHFIEHMLFKGTESRTAKDIAEAIDSIGGQINAFTGKEYTCFYTKTLDSHIGIALDVLSDMFFRAKISQTDLDVERKVILEEINMYEDSPEELVHDTLLEAVWSDNPLGYSILGAAESLRRINRQEMTEYIQKNYTPENTVIAVAGNFDYDSLLTLITSKFEGWHGYKLDREPFQVVNFNSQILVKEKDTEQTHICIGFEGVEQGNDRIYDLMAANNIFGGGMSSRLFQKIREEKGLAYSVYSYPSSYRKAGLFTIYSGMNPAQVQEVLMLILEEVNLFKTIKLSQQELTKAKEQLKGNYILGLESISSRMNSIGKSELLLRRIKTPEEVLTRIDAINIDSVNQVIEDVFKLEKMCFSAVGAIDPKLDFRKLLNM